MMLTSAPVSIWKLTRTVFKVTVTVHGSIPELIVGISRDCVSVIVPTNESSSESSFSLVVIALNALVWQIAWK